MINKKEDVLVLTKTAHTGDARERRKEIKNAISRDFKVDKGMLACRATEKPRESRRRQKKRRNLSIYGQEWDVDRSGMWEKEKDVMGKDLQASDAPRPQSTHSHVLYRPSAGPPYFHRHLEVAFVFLLDQHSLRDRLA